MFRLCNPKLSQRYKLHNLLLNPLVFNGMKLPIRQL